MAMDELRGTLIAPIGEITPGYIGHDAMMPDA